MVDRQICNERKVVCHNSDSDYLSVGFDSLLYIRIPRGSEFKECPERMAPTPAKIKELEERLLSLGIEEKDILEKFVRSQGRGGQKLNKTSSCVYLMHIPTGIEVKCQEDRSQSLNRFLARRILADKVEEALT